MRVELPEAGMRLDRFLTKRCTWRSRAEMQRTIDDAKVLVDGLERKASTKLLVNQKVVLKLDPQDEVPDPATIPLDVLHEDRTLLVLNKRPGIVVHPVGKQQLTSVLSALHARYRSTDPAKDRVPHLCHRIDKDTSGVFLVAFDENAKADVSLQFEDRLVKKEYLAIVHGQPADDEGAIDAPLLYEVDAWPRVRVDDAGQASRTRFRDTALVRFFPETGRMHQIRVHAKHLGHPLVCDTSYGGRGPVVDPSRPDAPVLGRCALHASKLTVRHPATGEFVTYEAPLAADMAAAVEWLREHEAP
jgi:23S rRNA pseudouridine1911/1915/1917 synthase